MEQAVPEYLAVNTDEMFAKARAALEAERQLTNLQKENAQVSAEELENMHAIINEGNQAAWEIAIKNKGLAMKQARRAFYGSGFKPNGAVDLEDVVMAATEGIFNAAKRFDPNLTNNKGASFFSFAKKYAWGHALNYMQSIATTIRLPNNICNLIASKDRFMKEYYASQGYYPARSLIAQVLGVPEYRLEELDVYRSLTKEMGSLNTGYSPQIDDPSDLEYGGPMKKIESDSPELPIDIEPLQRVRDDQVRETILSSDLDEREIDILIQRFGLDGSEPKTLEEVGDIYWLGRERIRQIEARALARLRNPVRADRLLKPERFTYISTRIVRTNKRDEHGNAIFERVDHEVSGRERIFE